MREKILAELRKKFPGLSSQILGQVADKLAATVTEETAIEGAISELDKLPISLTDYGRILQQEGDRRVTEAERTWKAKNPDPANPPKTDPPKTDPSPDDMPAWAKTLMTEVQTLRAEKTETTLGARLQEKLKDKKIPADFLKRYKVEKEEDLETVAAEVEADFAAVKQSLVNDGLLLATPPTGGTGNQSATAVDADIDAWAGKGADKKP